MRTPIRIQSLEPVRLKLNNYLSCFCIKSMSGTLYLNYCSEDRIVNAVLLSQSFYIFSQTHHLNIKTNRIIKNTIIPAPIIANTRTHSGMYFSFSTTLSFSIFLCVITLSLSFNFARMENVSQMQSIFQVPVSLSFRISSLACFASLFSSNILSNSICILASGTRIKVSLSISTFCIQKYQHFDKKAKLSYCKLSAPLNQRSARIRRILYCIYLPLTSSTTFQNPLKVFLNLPITS